ncbi:MAG TPA: hypothetical protein V6C81_15720 [Planktothrix sp.]|jgi:hypothetical protein
MKGLKYSLMSVAALSLVVASIAPSFAGDFKQNHPRRAEVLGRSRNINNRVNRNYGNLNGHYSQLKREDNHIVRQEQRDARQNGGHITKGEQKQLNKEENHVNNQIHNDEGK